MTTTDAHLRPDDHDEVEGAGRLWESPEVRWSALSGLLLLAGFVASLADAPDALTAALHVAAAIAGARFFALEAFQELVREREGVEQNRDESTAPTGACS